MPFFFFTQYKNYFNSCLLPIDTQKTQDNNLILDGAKTAKRFI